MVQDVKPRMRVSRVTLGRDEYRVLRPDRPTRRAFLFEDRKWALCMYVDLEAAGMLTAAWGLAARSRHSLVYVPMRANVPPEGVEGDVIEPLDLVLVQHSLQFPTSRWPDVRAGLGGGRIHAVRLPDDVFPDKVDYARIWHREYLDHLRFELTARTLFVIGGPEAFRRTGAPIRSLATDGPSYPILYPDAPHICAEIDAGRWGTATSRRCASRLHIQYEGTWTS